MGSSAEIREKGNFQSLEDRKTQNRSVHNWLRIQGHLLWQMPYGLPIGLHIYPHMRRIVGYRDFPDFLFLGHVRSVARFGSIKDIRLRSHPEGNTQKKTVVFFNGIRRTKISGRQKSYRSVKRKIGGRWIDWVILSFTLSPIEVPRSPLHFKRKPMITS